MAKNIIFCSDGTWNDADDLNKTNVFKLYNLLQGNVISRTKFKDLSGDIVEEEKAYSSTQPTVSSGQVAKYINGVGNSQNKIKKLLGGGFGAGLIERIVRGYTFVSRNYEPGDQIYLVGFSRGAYTSRALAGLIASQGLIANKFNRGATESYKLGMRAWYYYRKSVKDPNLLADFATSIVNLNVWDFLNDDQINPADFIANIPIAAVAVWDTVGSMGIPNYDQAREAVIDAFRFADTKLSTKVGQGLHAVALDEQRLLFTPTLWDAAANVKQLVFPGAHSDVGGGYKETGLSDGALLWMITQLRQQGVGFSEQVNQIKPDATAPAHQEWRHLTKGKGIRFFSLNAGLAAHVSVLERRAATAVVNAIGEAPSKYNPINWKF
jgi:uncharacterized protein (DUF2235 family)